MNAQNLKSDALLLLTAAIWGGGFVAQRAGMEHVGPFTFNATRFALGSLSLIALLLIRGPAKSVIMPPTPRSAKLVGSVLAGIVLFLGAAFQQVGLVYTTAGKAGFITGLYVVIVPILGLFIRQRPHYATWAGGTDCRHGSVSS